MYYQKINDIDALAEDDSEAGVAATELYYNCLELGRQIQSLKEENTKLLANVAALKESLQYMVDNIGQPNCLETRNGFIAAKKVLDDLPAHLATYTLLPNDPTDAILAALFYGVSHGDGEVETYKAIIAAANQHD